MSLAGVHSSPSRHRANEINISFTKGGEQCARATEYVRSCLHALNWKSPVRLPADSREESVSKHPERNWMDHIPF